MAPQTKPINSVLNEIKKLSTGVFKQSTKSGDHTSKQQKQAYAQKARFDRQQLSLAKQQTREMEKQYSIARKTAALGTSRSGGSPGGGGRKGGGLGMRIPAARAIPGLVASAAIGSIIGAVTSQVSSAISAFSSTGSQQRDLSGMMTRKQMMGISSAVKGEGFSVEDVLGATKTIGRGVGVNKPGEAPSGAIITALMRQKQMGIGTEESGALMASLRRSGVEGFDNLRGGQKQTGLRQFERIMAGGVASGLEKTRVPEHMQNMQKGMQSMGETVAGAVDVTALNRTFAMLGQIGPAFQGSRGFHVFQKFQNKYTGAAAGKGGADATAMALQDVGGFGGPGSTNSYFDALKQLEQGATPENIRKDLSGKLRRFGATTTGAMALSRDTGISNTLAEELLVAANSGGLRGNAGLDRLIKEAAVDTMSEDQKMVSIASSQAELAYQQFEQGEQLADTALEIQVGISQLVGEAIPLIRDMLEGILDFVDLTKTGIDILKDHFKDPTTVGTQQRLERLKQISAEMPNDQNKLATLTALKTAQEAELQGIKEPLKVLPTDSLQDHVKKYAENAELRNLLPGSEDAQSEIQGEIDRTQRRIQRDRNRKEQRKAEMAKLAQDRADKKAKLEAESRRRESSEATSKHIEMVRVLQAATKTDENAKLRAGSPPDGSSTIQSTGDTP